MRQGTFFKVDKDSIPEAGQILFRYLPVHIIKTEDEKDACKTNQSKCHHDYPVYVVLKPHSVDFFYHGPDKDCQSGKKTDDNKVDDNKTDDHHVHVRILHLPLSLNLAIKDNLTARLSSAFNNHFKLGKNYTFEINRRRLTYSTLPCFAGENRDLENETKLNGEIGKKILLKKLILDFIFDLERSSVFYASPHIEGIEVRLRENYFFSAIAAKAAYYYDRQLYLDNWRDKDISELYAINLVDTELHWLNIIRDKQATEAFWHQKWFQPVEREYHDVMFSGFDRYEWRQRVSAVDKEEEKDQQNIRILRETTRWFLRRYDLSHGFQSVLQYKEYRKYYLVPLVIFSFIFFPHYLSDLNNDNRIIALGIYGLAGLIPFLLISLGFIYRKMFLPILGSLLPRLMMAIASAWIMFTTAEEFWLTFFDTTFNEDLIRFFLLIPIVFFIAIEIRNQAPDISVYALTKRICYILAVGGLYSLLIGMFFMNLTSKKMLTRMGYLQDEKGFYAEDLQNRDIVILESLKEESIGNKVKAYQNLGFCKYEIKSLGISDVQLKYHIPIISSKSPEKKNVSFGIDVFPGMLIFGSLFALFVGIFVQLIFEDKPITEPL